MKTLKIAFTLALLGSLSGCVVEDPVPSQSIYCEAGVPTYIGGQAGYETLGGGLGPNVDLAKSSALASCRLYAAFGGDCTILKCTNQTSNAVVYQR